MESPTAEGEKPCQEKDPTAEGPVSDAENQIAKDVELKKITIPTRLGCPSLIGWQCSWSKRTVKCPTAEGFNPCTGMANDPTAEGPV